MAIKKGAIATTLRELKGLPSGTICKVVDITRNSILGTMYSLQAQSPCPCCGHKRIVMAGKSDFLVQS